MTTKLSAGCGTGVSPVRCAAGVSPVFYAPPGWRHHDRSLAAAAFAIFLLTGCTSQLPPGYVMLEDHSDARFRAVSADDCVLTLRSETNPRGGDLAFWEKTITQRLTEIRGYTLVSRQEVDNRTMRGLSMTFDYNRDGTDYTYLLGLFVNGSGVHVFEAAGQKGRIQKDMGEITRTMQRWPL